MRQPMKTARGILLALCGLVLATPFVYGDSRRSGSRTITMTYTYRIYGS